MERIIAVYDTPGKSLAGGEIHLEGLEYGWKKSVRHHHFFQDGSRMSLCGTAAYSASRFKEQEFLAECEITVNMVTCQKCYEIRKNDAVLHIKEQHRKSVGFWDDSHVCPKCDRPVIFFNHSNKEEHFCTVCDSMVTL